MVWPVKRQDPQRIAEPDRRRHPSVRPKRHRSCCRPTCCSGNNGRTLDPATGTQPGNARRTRENPRDPNADQAQTIRYQPTAYVSDEVLISVNPGRTDDIDELTGGLNAFLVPDDGPARAPSRLVPVAEDLARARGRGTGARRRDASTFTRSGCR